MSNMYQTNPLVGIAGTIGGISIAIVTILAIFAKDQLYVAAWVVGALAIMGAVLGLVAHKRQGDDCSTHASRRKAIEGE